MRKNILRNFLLTIVACTASALYAQEAGPFEYECNFDNDADFADGAFLPEGWAYDGTPLTRAGASYFGFTNHSGDYVIGAASAKFDEVIYTPLYHVEAGKPYTLEFAYYLPGGSNFVYATGMEIFTSSSQSMEGAKSVGTIAQAQNTEWKTFSVTVTPETSGKMCFALKFVNDYNMTNNCGAVGLDSFFISGTEADNGDEPGPGPGPEEPRGEPEEFEIECNFDVDADFADGAFLPEGWAYEGTPLTRAGASYFGFTNHSGDYVIGAASAKFDEVIYTPLIDLVAGKPCTLEFAYYLPGGSNFVYATGMEIFTSSSQSMEGAKSVGTIAQAQNTEWKTFSVTVTPETSGKMCFAFKFTNQYNMKNNCGAIGLDSFFISGTRYGEAKEDPEPELTPNEGNLPYCMELPYFETFSDETHYDGTSNLPIGWKSTGSVTWVTASLNALEAKAGEYYMIAYHNMDGERDDKAYTPFYNLEANKEYRITYYVYMQGNDYNEESALSLPELAFSVGTEQEYDFHKKLDTFSEKCTDWQKCEITFTPTVAGPYCFAFALTGPTNSGIVAIDDLQINAEGLIARTEPKFSVSALYSLYDESKTILYEGQPLKMVNMSKFATSYSWTAEGATPATSTAAEPEFLYTEPGVYTIQLTTTNPRGSRTTQHTYTIDLIGKTTQNDQALSLHNPSEDKIYERGQTPAFSTDEFDFISGYNHYYYELAQRFDLSESVPSQLKQMMFHVTDRRFRNVTSNLDDQRIRPFSIVVFGADENGNLDESKVFGRLDTTVGEALGSSGLGGNSPDFRSIEFPTPIEVKGTIYVAMLFDEGIEIDPKDANLGRSYFGSTVIRHGSGRTSLYVKPYNKPEASDAEIGKWCAVDRLDSKFTGMGLYYILWLNCFDESTSVKAIDSEGNAVATARFEGDNLVVYGTKAGDAVSVYNTAGVAIATLDATDGCTVAAMPGLRSGLYLVRGGSLSAKVIK